MGLFDKFKDVAGQAAQWQQRMEAQQQAFMDQMNAGQTPALLVPPPSEFVKRTTCASCGAPKQLPTIREYLYCDFCGQLVDYDLRRASESGMASPTSAQFAQVANQLGPAAEQARKAGDVAGYRNLQGQLYAAMAAYAPWSTPPRAWNDETYRNRWIHWSTEVAAANAFDPTAARYTDQVKNLALRLRWKGGGMLGMAAKAMSGNLDSATLYPKVEAESFWPLAQVVLEQVEYSNRLIDSLGLRELDPDGSAPSVGDRMARSMMAQGWLRSLEPEEGETFIHMLGLTHEYTRAQAVSVHQHSCAGCGYSLTAVDGARVVVCDSCGRRVEVGVPAIACTGCNAQISFPEGVFHVQCPFCQAEVQRI